MLPQSPSAAIDVWNSFILRARVDENLKQNSGFVKFVN